MLQLELRDSDPVASVNKASNNARTPVGRGCAR
jgi:hypothetical protein